VSNPVPAMLPWQVTINVHYAYKVDAINSAEACSEAVRFWRKDETVDRDERKKMVHDIHAAML
jgi:hypothetical protein